MRHRPLSLGAHATVCTLLLAACGGGSEPQTPTTVSVTPTSISFAAVGATQQLVAEVLDQNGGDMTGVTVTWSSGSPGVATVSATGLVTAVANGTTTVTATAGSATRNVNVAVAQVPTLIAKQGGDAQADTVGQALPTPLTVRIRDAGGAPIAGVAVAFAVTQGGGSVSAPSAATNASGDAQVTWTIGTVAGTSQQVTASTAGLAAVVTFTAVANPGPVALIAKMAGDDQNAIGNTAVAVPPRVKVTDAFGNAKPAVPVTFAVASGGGSVGGATANTDIGGLAQVGSWTLGPSGANSLTATVNGTSITTTFNATAATVGAPANMVVHLGDNQEALRGYATNVRPAVKVTDANNLPVAGVTVTFTPDASGSVTGGTDATDASGVAQVGSWIPGATAGTYTLRASAASLPDVQFTAGAVNPSYNIEVRNVGPALRTEVQAAFDSAVAKWQRIVYGDITPATVNLAAGACGIGPALSETIDDLVILATFDSIDGPSAILGQAGPCVSRSTGAFTVVGVMRFDSADVNGLISAGRLNDVILHEMGHVIGIGTHWSNYGCLQSPSSPPGSIQDTYFNCTLGRAVFDTIGGTSYTGGNKVPVENCGPSSPAGCGAGTVNSHWREPTFFNELMTGYLNSGSVNPLSVLTVASLGDIGYKVNYGAADAYTRTFTAPAAARGSAIDLGDHIYHGPEYFIDNGGRVVRVVRR